MVFTFAEAEFHWQSKWFFRPRQRIGTSVEDYYARFCDWKEEMISLSFPAEEEDYIEGFIENLSWDIRLRSSKYKSSRSRLSDAFYNAKFEESMMFIEENIKKIKANRVSDEMPTSVESQKVIKDDSVDEAKEKGELELTLVEGGLNQEKIDHVGKSTFSQGDESKKDVPEEDADIVFGKMIEPILGDEKEETTTKQTDCGQIDLKIDASRMFDKLTNNNEVNSLSRSAGKLLDSMSGQMFRSIEAAYQMFDKMSESISAVIWSKQVIESYTHNFNFNELTLFDPGGSGKSSPSVYIAFGESLPHSCLRVEFLSYPPTVGNLFVDEVGKHNALELGGLVTALYTFDKFPETHHSNWDDKSNWVSGLITNLSKFSTQDVSKGLSTSENEVRIEFEKWHGKGNNQELLNYSNVYGEFMVYNHLFVEICCRGFDPGGHFLPQMDRDVLKIDDDFWLSGILTFVFDPGGCSRPHMGCGSLECNNEQEGCCWAANVAGFLIIEVPWIMCQEEDVLQPMINICNGWYFDSYCPNNPNIPNTWIGNWTGRFKSWGGLEPLRIVGDVVFAIVKFEAASIDKAVRWLRYGCFWTIKQIRVIFIPSVFAATSELKVFDIIAQSVPEANLSASKIAAKMLKQAEDSSHVLDRMLPQPTAQSILDCHLVNNKDGKEDPRLLGLNYWSNIREGGYSLIDAVLEGCVPFDQALGMNLFELLGTYPILNRISNSAMHNRASFIMKKIHKVHQEFGSLKYGVGGRVIKVRNDPPKGNPKSGTPSVGNLFDLSSELVRIHDSARADVLGVPAKASIKEADKDDGYSPHEALLENFVWDPG